MKIFIIFLFLLIVTIISLFVGYEETQVPNDTKDLEAVRGKFLQIDINAKDLDLNKTIKEIKEARQIYPLDDKLKMIDLELGHKRANKHHNHFN